MFTRHAGSAVLGLAAGVVLAACDEPFPFQPQPLPHPLPDDTLTPPALVVATVTTGGAFDLDGFQLSIDGGAKWPIELNSEIAFASLRAGAHTIELSGISPNCVLNDGARRTGTFADGVAARVVFEVACVPPRELAGVRVIFARSNGTISWRTGSGIVSMNADGSERREMTDGALRDYGPNVSPDGRTIAFMRADPTTAGQPEIFAMSSGGGAAWPIIRGTAYDPEWSPDGSRLLFLTPASHWGGVMHVGRPDGGGASRLTQPSDDEDAWPTWSPDGTRIAFTRWSFASCCGLSIWIVNADGTQETPLTGGNPWGPFGPVWSPDGRIAFSDSDGYRTTSRIKVMKADGSAVTTLLESADPLTAHDWSADGRFLLFTKRGDVFMLRIADGSVVRLTADGVSTDPAFWPGS